MLLPDLEEETMAKLTDTQLIVLAKAAAHADGVAERPRRLPPAAAQMVAAALVSRGLMREIASRAGMPVWRTGEESGAVSLLITPTGRRSIGVTDEIEAGKSGDGLLSPPSTSEQQTPIGSDMIGSDRPAPKASGSSPQDAVIPLRTGTKQAAVVAMLSSPAGVTIDALMHHTGWLPHTTRAVLSGLRKRGHVIERMRDDDGRSRYRIAGGGQALAGV
jgi:hypothetical protein